MYGSNPCAGQHGGHQEWGDGHVDGHSVSLLHPVTLHDVGHSAGHLKQIAKEEGRGEERGEESREGREGRGRERERDKDGGGGRRGECSKKGKES